MFQTQLMSKTSIVSADMIAEFIQSMGVEIIIFALSIAFALAFRGTPLGKQLSTCQKDAENFKAPVTRPNQNQASRAPQTAPKREQKVDSVAEEVMQKIDCMVNAAMRRQSAEALAMYSNLREAGEHAAIKDFQSRGKKRASDIFASLVQCAGGVGRPEIVETLVADMVVLNVPRPLSFYEAAMKMLAAKKCYKEALSLSNFLEADGLQPSAITLSCLVSFAVEMGQSDRAISFFERLAACSDPSIRAYMTILRLYSKWADWQSSLALIRDMQKRQAPLDCLVLNIALSTGVAAHQLAETKGLLDEFAKMGLTDVVSFNTVMKGYAQQKDFTAALKLLDEMLRPWSKLKPNAITFNTAIDAGVRAGKVEAAWSVLPLMRKAGLAPDKFTVTTLMKGLQNGASSSQLISILDLQKKVMEEGDASMWSYLFRNVIEVAAKAQDPAVTARAIAQMREQRVIIAPQEYQRLMKTLLQDV